MNPPGAYWHGRDRRRRRLQQPLPAGLRPLNLCNGYTNDIEFYHIATQHHALFVFQKVFHAAIEDAGGFAR
jgi:hypothetical protein